MARRAGGKNYAPMVRSTVARLLDKHRDAVEKRIEEKLLDDPITTLKELSWLVPKELLVDVEQEVNIGVNTNMISEQALRAIHQIRDVIDVGDTGGSPEVREPITLDAPEGSTDSSILE